MTDNNHVRKEDFYISRDGYKYRYCNVMDESNAQNCPATATHVVSFGSQTEQETFTLCEEHTESNSYDTTSVYVLPVGDLG